MIPRLGVDRFPHRAARAALGVTGRRLRSQPFRPLLVVLGVALAFAMLVSVLGGSLVARQQALGRSLDAVPASAQGFRVDRFGLPLDANAYREADRRVRQVLTNLSAGPGRRVAFFRQLRVQGELVELAGVDRLAEAVALRSGRLPRTCTPARCEVLQVGSGGSDRLAEGDIHLRRVGIAELHDPSLFGYVSSATGGGRAATLLLGPGVDQLQRLSPLTPFYRIYSWLSPLRADRLRTWDVDRILAGESRAQASLATADTAFRLSGPDETLLEATRRGEVAAHRLVLVGGETSALLLGFAIIAAIGLRRGLASERRRLFARGARQWQAWLAAGAEVGSMTLAGALAGTAAGVLVVGSIARAAGLPAGAILDHALLAGWALAALVGGWAVATLVIALTTLARDDESGRRRVGLTDVAAVGAAATIGIGLSRGALDSDTIGSGNTVLLLVLPALVCFVAAAAVARLLAPLMRAAERLTRGRAVSLRLAVLALARAPSRTVVSCAFVAVALGLALFAASYRATLARGAADQAAFEVPLDFTVAEGSRLVPPLDAAPLARFEGLAPGTHAYPVVRLSATTAGSGASVLSPTVLGVPPEAVATMRWRPDYSPLAPEAIARRLGGSGEPRPVAVTVPPRARLLSLTARLRGSAVSAALVVLDPKGRVQTLPLGRVSEGATTLTAHIAEAGRVLGLQLTLPENERFTLAHQNAEGVVSTAPSGQLDLGPLVSHSGDGTSRALSVWRDWRLPAGGQVVRGGGRVRIRFAFEDTGARLLFRPHQPTDGRLMPVVASPEIARAAGGVGKEAILDFQDTRIPARVVGVAARLPTVSADSGPFVLAGEGWLSTAIETSAPGETGPNEVWIASPHQRAAVEARLREPPFSNLVTRGRADIERRLTDDPLAHATALALGAAGLVALALAILGFWVGIVSELRDERSDFFDLEAQGVAPRSLRSQLRIRAVILVGLGLAGGIGLGAILSRLVVSLVRVSGTNAVPEPPLRFDPSLLVSGLGVVLLGVAALAVAEWMALTAFRGSRPERASWSLE